ncbi:MAG: hypothetical protein IT456_10610 [Planctomycetes bacterium]|nr:hypothetical protein [Planctomycetota bacterium]
MSTLSTIHPTLLDVTKRLDPNGKIDKIAEILHQVNPILDDAVFIEANQVTGHRTTVRTGLPAPTWRKLYGGVQPTKSRTLQVTDSCGMLEAYAEIDKALADLNGNTADFRLSEELAHIEGVSQELAQTLFLGNETTEPEAFTGFGPRFNSQSAENGGNIITDAATPDNTDNSSIWLIVWGANTVHCIYPKGSKAGIQMEDKGQVTIENVDGNGGRMEGYRSHYRWDAGLTVRDWRYVVRVQVDAEDLTKNAASGPDLIDLLAQAVDLVPNINAGRAVFYANRTVRGFLRRQIMNKVANSTLSIEQLTRANGALVREIMFDGIPVRRCDAITNTESGI